jgi:hypothetical protein
MALGVAGTGGRFDHATRWPLRKRRNGRDARGKPPLHIVTNAPCDTCHKSTVTFAGARLNHRSVNAACSTCHNGRMAIGKPVKHVVTTAPCDTCHRSTIAFAGTRLDHNNVTAPCASCHNGVTAQGRSPRHLATTQPCDSCHRTTTWSVMTYRHTSALYPNHGSSIACNSCHLAGAQAVLWKFVAYKPDCAGCHAGEFKPALHIKSLKPAPVLYTVAELRDCTGACSADKRSKIRTGVSMHIANGRGW